MKKCYWCAEEIQDEAKICRYCGRSVVDPNLTSPENQESDSLLHYYPDSDVEPNKTVKLSPIKSTENIPQVINKELPPLRWHERLIWRSIFFGIFMGIILYDYVLGSTSPFGVFGFSGYLSNAVLQSFSSVVIYSGLYLLLGGVYRSSTKKKKYANFHERQAILRSELPFVIGAIFLFVLGLFGIEKLMSNSNYWTSIEPTIMNISTETISSPTNVTPTKKMATPTKKVSMTNTVITQQERALKSSILSYKNKEGWSFKPYLDHFDLVIQGNMVLITLLKSPVTEAEFKEIAYEFIRVTAFHVINGPISVKRSDWTLDFNVNNIRAISEDMADYTIAGYVEGYENMKKIIEKKYTGDLVTYEKYYD